MHERQVLHAAVMCALEMVQPLGENQLEFMDALLRGQVSKSLDSILDGLRNAEEFPVPV